MAILDRPFHHLPVDAHTDALIRMFSWVQDQIQRQIEALVAREGAPGTAMFLRRRLAIIDAMLQNASGDAHRTLPGLFIEAWLHGLKVAGSSDRLIGEHGGGVNREAIVKLADATLKDVDVALSTVGRRVADIFRQVALKQVALHIIAGTGTRAAAKTMERELVKRGVNAFVDKSGRRWSLGAYTQMVIRTTTREAMTQGTVAGLEADGQQLVTISHHPGSCPICEPFDGNTYALPGHDVPGYDTLTVAELPPLHPNCRHVLGPAAARFDRLEAELEAWAAGRPIGAPA